MCLTLQRQDADPVIGFQVWGILFLSTSCGLSLCSEAGLCVGRVVGVGEVLSPSRGWGNCQKAHPVAVCAGALWKAREPSL